MSITKKTAYALRALYEISVSGKGKPVSRKLISEKQKISKHFLEKILLDLEKTDITRSVRGPGGGFVLNKPENKITVWDIFTAVENKKHFYNKCALISNEECQLYKKCKINYIWPELNQAMKESLSRISLKDIISKNSSKVSQDNSRKN